MFGFRPDGRRIINEDPIMRLTPYLMPQRVDAQVHSTLYIDCDALTKYIRTQRDKGYALSYMDLVISAFVRACSQYPQLNRFIMNKQVFARKDICVSLTLLKRTENVDDVKEAAIKVAFDPRSTVYDIHQKMKRQIDESRNPDESNATEKLAKLILATPGLPSFIVSFVKFMDRYGLLSRAIIDLSPFHTSMFIANMASIGMPHVNHHIYNFGTTSLFLGMGKVLRNVVPGPNQSMTVKRTIPIGIVSDERITSGAEYGQAMAYFFELMNNPALMETPPVLVKYEIEPKQKRPHLLRKKKADEPIIDEQEQLLSKEV